MINWLNRKPIKPFVPFKTYNISEGDPQRMFVDIIVKEMEGRIESILEKKEQEAAEARSPRFIKESGVYLPSQPDYLWLMDCKLKERKNLSIQEYLSVEKLIEKTTMCEWGMVIDLWEKELEFVKTRAEVIESFENVIQSILDRREEKKLSFSSVDDVVISMSQLLSNEEQETV
uniref:Recombinase n=1 Tax=Strongyloides papillosus TaxID=174720 RepID=A0A0N5B261_STREA